MRINPALIVMAIGLSVAASGCKLAEPLTPEQMAAAVKRCHKLGLRADEVERIAAHSYGYAIVDIQCRTRDSEQ